MEEAKEIWSVGKMLGLKLNGAEDEVRSKIADLEEEDDRVVDLELGQN